LQQQVLQVRQQGDLLLRQAPLLLRVLRQAFLRLGLSLLGGLLQ
jgi:hypothetical protein